MAEIELRRRRSEDELEPFYVRIAEPGDAASLAFTENTASLESLDAATETLRQGRVTTDRLYDRGNDKWFFRFKDATSGEVLFRSMPCDDEATMEERISRILAEAPAAAFIDDTGAQA